MPPNDQTGKTDRHLFPKEYFKVYCLEQAQQKVAKENVAKETPSARGRARARARGKGKGKGKKRAGNSPGAGEPEASASVPPPQNWLLMPANQNPLRRFHLPLNRLLLFGR